MDGGEGSVVGGRYTLLRRLGRGGMAEVWLAADQRLGDKQVAIKRLLGYRADSPESAHDVERARREALAASRLNHPNLVAVTDFVAEDGEPFIVMEYVDGTTLSELIAADGLPPTRAARILGHIAAAVAEAHAAGIIHRDIKPANILVTRRDVAKLADFGIARTDGDSRLTRTGFFSGTVAYLAPELLDGAEATSASDVWALGAVLFETVEGRPAFDGDTTPSVIAAIALRELPVPRRAPALAPLIAGMLERDPRRRATIDEVAAELSAVAGHGAPAAAPSAPPRPPAPETVRTPSQPHAALPPPSGPPHAPLPPPPAPPPRSRSRRGWWIAAVAVVAVIAAVIGVLVSTSGDGSQPAADSHSAAHSAAGPAGPAPTTSATGASTTAGASSTTTTAGAFRVLAHRGGRESYAEESLPALVQAAKDGYAVETDIRWTSDGVAVIVHDATTAGNLECTGGPYTVATTTAAVLQRNCHSLADASPDHRTYPVATFDQVAAGLEAVPGATIFAEVKVTQTPKQVSGFLSILMRHSLIDRAVVTSFYPAELAKMQNAAKPLGTTLTLLQFVSDAKTGAAALHSRGLAYVAVETTAASRAYLTSLRTAGLKTVVWTADTEAQWAAARAAGADYVVTDVPGAYLKWLAGR